MESESDSSHNHIWPEYDYDWKIHSYGVIFCPILTGPILTRAGSGHSSQIWAPDLTRFQPSRIESNLELYIFRGHQTGTTPPNHHTALLHVPKRGNKELSGLHPTRLMGNQSTSPPCLCPWKMLPTRRCHFSDVQQSALDLSA